MKLVAEAVALGLTLDLPRDLLFDTLAKNAVVVPAHIGKLASAKRRDYAPQFPACDCARGESAAGGAEP